MALEESVGQNYEQTLVLPLTSCVTLGKLFNLSGPLFPLLQLQGGLHPNSCLCRRPPWVSTQAGEGTGNPIKRGGCKGHEVVQWCVGHAILECCCGWGSGIRNFLMGNLAAWLLPLKLPSAPRVPDAMPLTFPWTAFQLYFRPQGLALSSRSSSPASSLPCLSLLP